MEPVRWNSVFMLCVREWGGGAEQSHLCKMFILIMILSDMKRYEVILGVFQYTQYTHYAH